MVARVDLDRLAVLAQGIRRSPDLMSVGWRTFLWDSDNVSELMPLAEGAIENLPATPVVVVLAERRRHQDPSGWFSVTPEPDAERRAASVGLAAWEKRMRLVTDPVLSGPGARSAASDAGYFVPTYFTVFRTSLAVHGVFTMNDGQSTQARFEGDLWDDASMRIVNRSGEALPVSEASRIAQQGVWGYLSATAQNLLWCVTHPEQFPVTHKPAADSVVKRDHIRAARKAGVDLAAVTVIDWRPRVVAAAVRGAGGSRAYRYSFPVRGHWRKQPSGLSVWVAGYWKATDKPRLSRQTVDRF